MISGETAKLPGKSVLRRTPAGFSGAPPTEKENLHTTTVPQSLGITNNELKMVVATPSAKEPVYKIPSDMSCVDVDPAASDTLNPTSSQEEDIENGPKLSEEKKSTSTKPEKEPVRDWRTLVKTPKASRKFSLKIRGEGRKEAAEKSANSSVRKSSVNLQRRHSRAALNQSSAQRVAARQKIIDQERKALDSMNLVVLSKKKG